MYSAWQGLYRKDSTKLHYFKGGFAMDDKKGKIIKSSIEDYKKLPVDKQMFVLGYMQGVLSNQKDEKAQAV